MKTTRVSKTACAFFVDFDTASNYNLCKTFSCKGGVANDYGTNGEMPFPLSRTDYDVWKPYTGTAFCLAPRLSRTANATLFR